MLLTRRRRLSFSDIPVILYSFSALHSAVLMRRCVLRLHSAAPMSALTLVTLGFCTRAVELWVYPILVIPRFLGAAG